MKKFIISESILNLLVEQIDTAKPNAQSLIIQAVQADIKPYEEAKAIDETK